MVTIWLICGDGIICTASGVPFVLTTQYAPSSAICLAFGETHQATTISHANKDCPVSHVMDLQDACQLGLIARYGNGYDSKYEQNLQLISFRQLLNTANKNLLNQLTRAIMLNRWNIDHRFCSRCGVATTTHQHEHAKICPKCRHHAYPRVQPCIIVAITRHNPTTNQPQLLLACHTRHKDSGVYGLIAGFVEAGETLEMATHREVFEEVGLQIDSLSYFGSQPWPYPSNLMVGFVANYAAGEICIEPNEIFDAQFFDIDKLPKIASAGTISHDLIMHVLNQFSAKS